MEIGWDALRATEFPVTSNWAYFDHAAVAPLPRRAGDALRAWTWEQEQNGVVNWPAWEAEARGPARPARGLDPCPPRRDRVCEQHHARNRPGRRGLSLARRRQRGDPRRRVPLEYLSLDEPGRPGRERAPGSRPRRPDLAGRSGPGDGRQHPRAGDQPRRVRLGFPQRPRPAGSSSVETAAWPCSSNAIQGLGPLRIDVERTPIDFLAADGHKWLLGPEGAGLLYVRRHWIDRLRPLGVGWHSVVGSYNSPEIDFRLKPSAQRWEGGSFNMPGLQALGASVSLLLELGPDAVSNRILDRAQAVRELAARAGWRVTGSKRPEDHSGIVALEHDEVPSKDAAQALKHDGDRRLRSAWQAAREPSRLQSRRRPRAAARGPSRLPPYRRS